VPNQLGFVSQPVTLVSSVAQLASSINPSRSYLAIQNTGTGALLIGFSSAPTGGNSLSLDPAGLAGGQGGSWEWRDVVPMNSIYLYSAAGTTAVIVTG
jgi:hypothetical protein